MLWENRLDAETADSPQQNDLRLPRRLRQEAGAVQGGVKAPVGGVEPPPAYAPRNREVPGDKRVRPSTRHMMALLALAVSLGLGHLFNE